MSYLGTSSHFVHLEDLANSPCLWTGIKNTSKGQRGAYVDLYQEPGSQSAYLLLRGPSKAWNLLHKGSNWIVTAAHCLHQSLDPEDPTLRNSDLLSPSNFKIIMGKHWRLRSDENEQHLGVKRIFLHPLYDPKTFENDVALVELSESPVLNDFVMPICLPEGPSQEGAVVIVSGWGKQFLQRFPETLMEIEIPIVDHRTCQEAYAPVKKKVTRDMICAGEKEGGMDACAGDSGGPMVTLDRERGQWYLVGTVSWGEDCGKKDRYGVYSYVYHNKNWIRRVTGIRN